MPGDPKRMSDGLVDVSGGMDSGKSPSLASAANPDGLARNQVAFAVNCTSRGGKLKPRPGLKQIRLDLSAVDGYSAALFQGAEFYDPGNGRPVLVASIGGRQFQYSVNSGAVAELTIAGDPNAPNLNFAYFLQAENYLVIQDGQANPIIYNGAMARRADQSQSEVPCGTIMAYTMGRIAVTLTDGYSYRIGDLVFGPSGTLANGYRDAVLKFTENNYLSEGGDLTARVFGTSNDLGPITAMRPLAQLDNSLGQGPLQIFTTNGGFSVNLPFDRTTWKNLANPLQAVDLLSFGALSQSSAQLVNSDIYYRAKDGIRSLINAIRYFGQPGNTPMSREMDRVLAFDDRDLLAWSSAVNFDNRYLLTCSPVKTAFGVYHRGLIALDLDLVSSLREKDPPAYDGLWIGPKILKVIKGEFNGADRCFIFSLEEDNTVGLWELTLDNRFDNDATPIIWWFETPAYPFGFPFTLKRLDTGDMWIDDVTGAVVFNLSFRPDRYPGWIAWQSWAECANTTNCQLDPATGCLTIKSLQEQFRPRMTFKRPPETVDHVTKRPFCDGYEHQARVSVSGYCEITQLRLHAFERQETAYGPLLTAADCVDLIVCPGTDF